MEWQHEIVALNNSRFGSVKCCVETTTWNGSANGGRTLSQRCDNLMSTEFVNRAQDEDDHDFALRLIPFRKDWDLTDVETKVDIIRRRLNSRCHGLIEICRERPRGSLANASLQRPTVQYLHKTARTISRALLPNAGFWKTSRVRLTHNLDSARRISQCTRWRLIG